MPDAPRLLILETSHQPGLVALAEGPQVLGERRLDEARRHARDLVPATAALLGERGWKARELTGVIVSQGPGSYTGLRVGLMSAKTLAFATGAALIGVPTFAAIARQAPSDARLIAVLADAQQGKVYVQHFESSEAGNRSTTDLAIRVFDEWLQSCPPGTYVAGPALEVFAPRFPSSLIVAPRETWTPSAASLLGLGLARFEAGDSDDPFTLEPIYLRPSSAEEKWVALGRK